ncbi:MAG TPA: glycerol-3-phosphate responsive antiterminator [Negativicutes bacterium]|nr:glycerol-3-phosphate responsive antiterminator [Negativicutes bacterium]
MTVKPVVKMLYNRPVIPAVRTPEDYEFALHHTDAPSIIVLFGDILALPHLVEQAKQTHKRLIVHLDLMDGLGKDASGVKFLARSGVGAMITTKAHLAKVGWQEGMLVIQRLFLMDSEALRIGMGLLAKYKPDAIEVLPGVVPAAVISELARVTGLPVLGGGLITTRQDVDQAIANGLCAVSTSKRELWLPPPLLRVVAK